MLDAMNAAAWGANGYFSLKTPTTLKSIKWIIDEKSLVDEFTREYIQNWASGEGHRHQYEIREIQGIVPNKIQKYHPSGYTSGFSAGKVFQDVNYSKSEDHIGLQVADLLAGSLRRCLKEAWEKNTSAVAGALSKLMIRQTPWLTITESKPESGKANKSILPISNRFKELVLEEPSALAILSEGAPLPKRP